MKLYPYHWKVVQDILLTEIERVDMKFTTPLPESATDDEKWVHTTPFHLLERKPLVEVLEFAIKQEKYSNKTVDWEFGFTNLILAVVGVPIFYVRFVVIRTLALFSARARELLEDF